MLTMWSPVAAAFNLPCRCFAVFQRADPLSADRSI